MVCVCVCVCMGVWGLSVIPHTVSCTNVKLLDMEKGSPCKHTRCSSQACDSSSKQEKEKERTDRRGKPLGSSEIHSNTRRSKYQEVAIFPLVKLSHWAAFSSHLVRLQSASCWQVTIHHCLATVWKWKKYIRLKWQSLVLNKIQHHGKVSGLIQ